MAYALLISTDDVKKFTILNGNLDVDDFIQYIKIAQDITIQNYLGTDFTETAMPDPRTPYAWSKYLCEYYHRQHQGGNTVNGIQNVSQTISGGVATINLGLGTANTEYKFYCTMSDNSGKSYSQ